MHSLQVKYKMSEESEVVESTDIPTAGPIETTDMSSAIKCQMQDVDTIKKRPLDCEKIIDKLVEAIRMNIKDTIEVDGKEIPLHECAARLKSLSSHGNSDDGLQDRMPQGPEDTRSRPTTTLEDNECQIQMLKAEIEILRTTLQEASEREQHLKLLVGQLDMADSRAQKKWESFHNSVVQQWSNHCQLLQRQLSFTAMKLQQHINQSMSEEAGQQTTEIEDNEAIGLENGDVPSVAAVSPSAPPLSDGSEDSQETVSDDAPHPSAPHSPIIPGMPWASFPMLAGHAPPPPFPRMPFHDNCTPTSYTTPPPPPPPPLDLRDPPFISEKMTSARQLQRFFTNLSLIEKAQKEGRAYRNSDQDFRDQDTGRHTEHTEFGHNPRRSRAYDNRYPAQYNDQYDEERVVESDSFPDAGSDDSHDRDTKQNRLTPTAMPFIPANHVVRNVDEN